MLSPVIAGSTLAWRRWYWSMLGYVLVRCHYRSRPCCKWTGVKDVRVREYIRRFPNSKR
jgi:hypothetical protein